MGAGGSRPFNDMSPERPILEASRCRAASFRSRRPFAPLFPGSGAAAGGGGPGRAPGLLRREGRSGELDALERERDSRGGAHGAPILARRRETPRSGGLGRRLAQGGGG